MLIRLSLISACLTIAACAGHPTTPAPVKPTTAATAAKAPSGTNQASASGQVHTLVLEDKTLTQAEVNAMLSQGYKPQKGRGDQVLYCRTEAQLGTHFERKVCMTAEQIRTMTQDSRVATESLQRNLGNEINKQ